MTSADFPESGWLYGLVIVSGGLGLIVSFVIWDITHRYFRWLNHTRNWNHPLEKRATVEPIPVLIGIVERLFFTVLVAFEIQGVGTAIVGWIALKQAIGWGVIKEGTTAARALAILSLIPSIASLLLALLGGLIWNGTIHLRFLNAA